MRHSITIPADVPRNAQQEFTKNYAAITRGTNRLFLFSCDQKIEHLHEAFDSCNQAIHSDAQNPEHLFRIASQGTVGAMATQLELIARYAKQYPAIRYIAKLNSKTNIVPTKQKDPFSAELWDIDDVVSFKNESKLSICGVGTTVYLGSEFEDRMLSFAAETIFNAHQYGLITILWMYPRGKAVKDETDAHIIAGAAGAANALGADFVKIKSPMATATKTSAQLLQEIVAAAGNTKVICSGGEKVTPQQYLEILYDQLHNGHVSGTATGRNIFQESLLHACALTKAISALVYDNAPLSKALNLLGE